MRLGLIADIHESVESLERTLARFREEKVDRVVVLGDLYLVGEQMEETCRLLAEAGAVGVWGNHDHGLCTGPPHLIGKKFPSPHMSFMRSLRPRLQLDGCYFSHVEPWLDPENIHDLWFLGGLPEDRSRLGPIFAAVPHRIIFAGHYHHWLLATPSSILAWAGEKPVQLDDGRYFVALAALLDGRYAMFDTETSLLVPFNDAR